jgi:integrase
VTFECNILEDILKNKKPIDAQIQSVEQELAALDEKRKELQARIKQLKGQQQSIADEQLPFERLSELNVTNDSTREQKIALFRSLFRGREDAYARRFESKRTGKSGYQPVCRNEWIRPICQKPKIKCGRFEKGGFIFHNLRHTFNTNMRKAGVAESVIMKITGHSTREMFDRYNTIDEADTMQAIDQMQGFLSDVNQSPESLNALPVK